jgi:hypothetical protein
MRRAANFSLFLRLRTALQLTNCDNLSSENPNSRWFQRDCLGCVLAWLVNDSAGPLRIAFTAEAVGLLFLLAGVLILITGCITFCARANANQVLLVGSIISGISLVVIPILSSLSHFEAKVHDWTGLLFFFIWVPACVLGSIFVLVGVSRLFLKKRQRQ